MKTLSRRTFLRGTGVSVALPLLEAMIGKSSAQSRTPNARLPRLVCCYIPNGVNIMKWTPQGEGRNWELSPSLEPLAPLKEHVTCLTGLEHPRAFGGHSGADVFLTGADLNGAPGKDYANSISVDQAAARVHGLQTRIPSLELSFHNGTGSAGHSITLAFNDKGTPLPAENRPQVRPISPTPSVPPWKFVMRSRNTAGKKSSPSRPATPCTEPMRNCAAWPWMSWGPTAS